MLARRGRIESPQLIAARWTKLRYQLVTGLAGTAIEAGHTGARIAAFLVHEFRTERTNAEKLEVYAHDFASFVGALGLCPPSKVRPGQLFGPMVLERGPLLGVDVKILIGKAVYAW